MLGLNDLSGASPVHERVSVGLPTLACIRKGDPSLPELERWCDFMFCGCFGCWSLCDILPSLAFHFHGVDFLKMKLSAHFMFSE